MPSNSTQLPLLAGRGFHTASADCRQSTITHERWQRPQSGFRRKSWVRLNPNLPENIALMAASQNGRSGFPICLQWRGHLPTTLRAAKGSPHAKSDYGDNSEHQRKVSYCHDRPPSAVGDKAGQDQHGQPPNDEASQHGRSLAPPEPTGILDHCHLVLPISLAASCPKAASRECLLLARSRSFPSKCHWLE
jgi:hypothetical protein